MAAVSRSVTEKSIEAQARMLGMELVGIDAAALAERVSAGMNDLDRLGEPAARGREPSVKFDSAAGAGRR